MTSDLSKRLLTAGVLVPLILAALYLDSSSLAVVVIVVIAAMVAADEYLCMQLKSVGDSNIAGIRAIYAVCVAVVAGTTAWFGPSRVAAPVLSGVALVLAVAVLTRPGQLEHAVRRFAALLSGLVYVPLLMSVWPLIKESHSVHWLTITLCAAFLSDTVAYFVGRSLGRRKLLPRISPKKTVEGAFGGLAGGVLATYGVGSLWLLPQLPAMDAIVLGVLASCAGQVGDLVESMLKRGCGVKDSGKVLPGHGGVLDRVDALLFVAPVIFYYCEWFQS